MHITDKIMLTAALSAIVTVGMAMLLDDAYDLPEWVVPVLRLLTLVSIVTTVVATFCGIWL